MSMTLILWKAPVVDDPDEAKALLTPWYATGDESAFEPSDDLAAVYDELLRKYPMDWEKGADPWADGPDNTGRLLVLSIRWGGDGRILADITALARNFELVLYDPQGPDVFLPTDPIEELTEDPPPTARDFVNVIMLFIPIAAATVAAWWFIPWGWLRWPLVAIGLFFTIAAFIVVYATVAAAFARPKDEPTAR